MYFVNVFLRFHYNLPLEKRVALHLNNLESSSPKDALSQVWLKSGEGYFVFKFR